MDCIPHNTGAIEYMGIDHYLTRKAHEKGMVCGTDMIERLLTFAFFDTAQLIRCQLTCSSGVIDLELLGRVQPVLPVNIITDVG